KSMTCPSPSTMKMPSRIGPPRGAKSAVTPQGYTGRGTSRSADAARLGRRPPSCLTTAAHRRTVAPSASPGGSTMDSGHRIDIQNTAYFRHVYDGDQPEMRRLYEQAKRDQWNASTDIDWARPLEGDGGLIADDLVDVYGTRFWDRMSEAERVELNRR